MNREHARALITRLGHQDPDLVDLAERVSLALSVDPHFLRLVRTKRFPNRGPDLEADLWLSPLVQTPGVDGFLFHPAVTGELLARLGSDEKRLKEATGDLQDAHDWLPGSLTHEERIWVAIAPGTDTARREADELVAEVVAFEPPTGGGGEVTISPEALERWRSRDFVRRLPPAVGSSGLVGRLSRSRHNPDIEAVSVWVRFLPGAAQLVLQEDEPGGAGWAEIELATQELWLDGGVDQATTLTLEPGNRRLVAAGTGLTIDDGRSRWHIDRSRRVLSNRELEVELTEDLAQVKPIQPAEILAFREHSSPVWAIAFSPDGTKAATASTDGTARIWDTTTGTQHSQFTNHTSTVLGIAFSPDGTKAATASRDGTARIWDTTTGTQHSQFTNHTSEVWGIAFSPDGTKAATASTDGTARIWDTTTGTQHSEFTNHTSAVLGIAFSPDGPKAATASADGTARIWDTTTGTQHSQFTNHTSTVWGIAFSPDGTKAATASADGTARIWDTTTGTQHSEFTNHTSAVYGIAFSPDGTKAATASDDGTARIWDTTTGTQHSQFTNHTSTVYGIAFSPDGTKAATASDDGTARIWDTTTGMQVAVSGAPAMGTGAAAVMDRLAPEGLEAVVGGAGYAPLHQDRYRPGVRRRWGLGFSRTEGQRWWRVDPIWKPALRIATLRRGRVVYAQAKRGDFFHAFWRRRQARMMGAVDLPFLRSRPPVEQIGIRVGPIGMRPRPVGRGGRGTAAGRDRRGSTG